MIYLKKNVEYKFLSQMNIGVGETDTLKFNLHIIRHAKKGCEFNQKRCELKFSFIKSGYEMLKLSI
jgi:hypothetical protein